MTQAEQAKRREAIYKARVEGASISALCRRFDVCTTTIVKACRERGLRVPYTVSVRSDAKRHPFAVLAALKAPDKVSDAQVARDCGLSRERVRQIKEHARRTGLL